MSLQVTCAVATSAARSSSNSGVVLAMNCSTDGVGSCPPGIPAALCRPCRVSTGAVAREVLNRLGTALLSACSADSTTCECDAVLPLLGPAPAAACCGCGACSAKALEASICRCCSSSAQSCASVAASPGISMGTCAAQTHKLLMSIRALHGSAARQALPSSFRHLLVAAPQPQVSRWSVAMAGVLQARAGGDIVQHRSLPGCE